jgi:hypothetical protein
MLSVLTALNLDGTYVHSGLTRLGALPALRLLSLRHDLNAIRGAEVRAQLRRPGLRLLE